MPTVLLCKGLLCALKWLNFQIILSFWITVYKHAMYKTGFQQALSICLKVPIMAVPVVEISSEGYKIKAELLQLNRTQFPSLGIFVSKKVGNQNK